MRRTSSRQRLLMSALAGVISLSFIGSASAAITRKDAYRMGKRGVSATKILRTAFPGVAMARMKEAPIRVLLAEDLSRAVVAGQSSLALIDAADTASARVNLPAEHRFEVTRNDAGFVIKDLDGSGRWTTRGAAIIDSLGAPTGIRLADPVTINRRYRGALRMQRGRQGTIQVVNVLDVEHYLLGTLPGDMPDGWGAAAPNTLSAGAVALRSRALTQRKLPSAPFDFTAQDPKYLGLDGERVRTSRAVHRTRNLTLRRGRFPYPASFSGVPVMGSNAFQPRTGKPVPVAFGPTRPVQIDTSVGGGAAGGRAKAALDLALTFVGTPYLWGGSAPGGFDCSGLVYYVYAKYGVKLPRVAADQARVGEPIRTIAALLPGDTVFFADSSGYIHHMGLYIGGGKMVHAPRTGDFVKISDITSGYYLSRFAGGRRYVPAA